MEEKKEKAEWLWWFIGGFVFGLICRAVGIRLF